MRYDIVRQKRRYEMLDKNSRKEVLDLIDFFGKINQKPYRYAFIFFIYRLPYCF